MESTTTEEALVAEGPPEEANGIGAQEKTTETDARSILATVHACIFSRRSIPGKIWIPTNQIRTQRAHAHLSRELCARAVQISRGI